MRKAGINDSVKVQYICTAVDGQITSLIKNENPVEFTVGEGKLLPTFEKSIIGMETHHKKSINIPCSKAYGKRRSDLIQEISRDIFPVELETSMGDFITYTQDDGSEVQLKVVDIKEDSIIIDANHPLAGKDLQYDIELLEIK